MTSSSMVMRQSLLVRRLPKYFSSRTMSSDIDEVVFKINRKGGFMVLNRPKALNALNTNMVELISQKLCDWEKKLQYVVVRGSGRAFCAGGDIVNVTRGGPQKTSEGEEFFRKEYTMNHQINQLRIPYVAIIDGITMGGGVGLSVHGKYRVATENTLFAMPETQIGLFPDVGGSHFLSRLGPLGMYLALSGYRLQGVDVAKAGIATHFVESSKLPELLDALENDATADNLDGILNKHSKCIKSSEFSLSSKMDLINATFSLPTVEKMLDQLKSEGSEWSLNTANTLSKMSPTSLKITVRELSEGKTKTLKECLEMEYRLAVSALRAKISCDFYEGVRALLVDKDKKPVWNPPRIEAVTDDTIDKAFEKFPCPDDELVL